MTKIYRIGQAGIRHGKARLRSETSFGFLQLHNWNARVIQNAKPGTKIKAVTKDPKNVSVS